MTSTVFCQHCNILLDKLSGMRQSMEITDAEMLAFKISFDKFREAVAVSEDLSAQVKNRVFELTFRFRTKKTLKKRLGKLLVSKNYARYMNFVEANSKIKKMKRDLNELLQLVEKI